MSLLYIYLLVLCIWNGAQLLEPQQVEVSSQESVLSLLCVSSRDRARVIRLDNKHFYLLSHLIGYHMEVFNFDKV